MALNKKLLTEKLEEWAKLSAKIKRLDAQKNKDLDPFVKKHNEEIAPILADYNAKAVPLNEQWDGLTKEINVMIEKNADADGNPKLLTHLSDNASVVVARKEGARVVYVEKFFDFVKDKTADFWKCLTVKVGDADKLIGKSQVDDLSEKKITFSIEIKANK